MATCIFCPAELGRTTKPEHILISAFGGKKTTQRVICSACNNLFGSGIDTVLAKQFAGIRNMLQLYSGTGKAPPALRNVKAGREKIDIGGDGKIILRSKPFTITEGPQGKQLQINSGSFEEIAALIPTMAAALKIPPERLRDLISQQKTTIVERRPDPILQNLQFGGPEAVRSAAKSCLVLWATLVGNREVSGPDYEQARQFILGRRTDLPGGSKTDLDSRIYDLPPDVAAEYGPAFNMIYVRSDKAGQVVGHFTMYNILAISVVLAEAGGSPDRQIALISNPITRGWSDKIADVLDIPFEWLSSPDYDAETMERSRLRISKIMDYYVESGKSKRIREIIEDVLKGHGLKEGDRIPVEMAQSISKEISERTVSHLFNRPYKKEVAPERIREILDAEAVKLNANARSVKSAQKPKGEG